METALTNHQSNPAHTARFLRQHAQSPVATMEEAQSLLATCETLRRPVDPEWLMGRVATLLGQFFVSQTEEAEMRAMLADWRDALAEFPQWAVAEACSEWLRTQERKPTIAAIRKLAQQHFAVVEFTRQKAMRGPQEGRNRKSDIGNRHSEEHCAAMRERMASLGAETVKAMRDKLEAGA